MEEDDDAFLYGEDAEQEVNAAKDGQQTTDQIQPNATMPLEAEAPVVGEVGKGDDDDGGGDDDDDDDDDDDSDSDLEIIVDGSAGPPVGYNARQPIAATRPVPVQRPPPSTLTSDYIPNLRPGQAAASSSLASLTGLDAATSEQPAPSPISAPPLKQGESNDFLTMNQLPEGPPPAVPITAPRLDLDPLEESLMLPPETVDGEPGPLIYHVDPTEFEEKPWRRPGADLTDWFNYGFNEESWKLWGEKKHSRTTERRDLEVNGGRYEGTGNGYIEQSEHKGTEQANGMPQVPPQQLQAMQAMMGATGLSMSPEQMMAFMGMGPGSMPGMSGMGIPGGQMMGMPSMVSMFGQNPNLFGNNVYNMPNMHMMPPSMQPQQGGPSNGGSQLEGTPRLADADEGGNAGLQNESNDDGVDEAKDELAQSHKDPQADLQSANTMETSSTAASKEDNDLAIAARAAPLTHPLPAAPVLPRGPSAGLSIQGRAGTGGANVPTGPSAERLNGSGAGLPASIPTGPKNPGRRYNDRDSGMGAADSLDYGAGQGGGHRDERSPRVRRDSARDSPESRRKSDSRDASQDRERERDGREYDRGDRLRDRERDRERDRGSYRERGDRDRDDDRRRTRDRGHDRSRHSSPEDEPDRASSTNRRERRGDERVTSLSHRHNSNRRGEDRDDSRSMDRDEDWDRESIGSTASRRRGAPSRQPDTEVGGSRRSSARSERRRGGEADSGSETEKERKYGRSQARANRRAGRDDEDTRTSSTRKRSAPEDDLSPPRTTSSRRRR